LPFGQNGRAGEHWIRRTGEHGDRKHNPGSPPAWRIAHLRSPALLVHLIKPSASVLLMAFMFENLQVYQKAVDFADRAAGLTETFPRGYRYLADQPNRASLSIAANIAEGNGRLTKACFWHPTTAMT